MIEELRAERWFGGKSRGIRHTRVLDRACWVADASVCLVEVEYDAGAPETYVLADHLDEPRVARALLDQFHGTAGPTEAGGRLEFRPTHVFEKSRLDSRLESIEPIAVMRGEQSNTSIRFGTKLILKLFRRVQFGPNPDVEVGWFLTENSHFRGTPAVMASLSYIDPNGRDASLALLQRFEPNRGDAWTTTLQRLSGVLGGGDPTESVAAMARLGRTTAEMHLALASGSGDFSAESILDVDIAAWRLGVDEEVSLAAEALARRDIRVDSQALLRRADGIAALEGALKTRHHGDFHLGQVLERDDGSFVIIDFEGEPSKPLAQRREKRSPLRDVAGMLRSLDYARHAALRSGDSSDADRVRRAAAWYQSAREAFVSSYLSTVRPARPALLPTDVYSPLEALEMEKAAYEVLYELNNRPEWLPIPLAAVTSN